MGWLRRMKTTQERRRWFADIEILSDYPQMKMRARRSARNLPTVYDDVPKLNGDDRSWKMHRDTQWGVKRSVKKNTRRDKIIFDTPLAEMHKPPYWFWGFYSFGSRAKRRQWPFRVRFKYIKNRTA